MTPLQVAFQRLHSPGVIAALLSAGSDVNAVGDPDAIRQHYLYHGDIEDLTNDGPGAFFGIENHCSTPLRLAEDAVANFPGDDRFHKVLELLQIQAGARSEMRGVDFVKV
jgi:hypothetical protein